MADATKTEDKPKRTPKSLITEEGVKKALEAQCGPDAELRSWEVIDFTKKGDNYACVVSSVVVTYIKYLKKQWTSFVVKLNPCEGLMSMNDIAGGMFMKEGNFYTQLVPELNKILVLSGQPELKLAKCYNASLNKDEEIIYLEDLRDEGFKMTDRKKGLDAPHLTLVLQELGRMHAASMILQGSKSKKELIELYPCLEEKFFDKEKIKDPIMEKFSSSQTENSSEMLEQIDGYQNIAKQIKEIEFFSDAVKEIESAPPFEVICHGDCWTNNVLFK